MNNEKDRDYYMNLIKLKYPSVSKSSVDEMMYLSDKWGLDVVTGDVVMLGSGGNFKPYVTYHGLMKIMTNARRDMEIDFEIMEDTETVFSVKCVLRVPPPVYKTRVDYYKDMLSLGLTYEQARAEITSTGYEKLVKRNLKDHMRKYYVVLGKKQAFKDAFNFTSHKILSEVVPIDFGIIEDDTADTFMYKEPSEAHTVGNSIKPSVEKDTGVTENLKLFVNKVSSFIGEPISSTQKKRLLKELTGHDGWKSITKEQSESMLLLTKTKEGLEKIKGIITDTQRNEQKKDDDDDEHNKEKMVTRSAEDDDDTQPRNGDVSVAKKLKYIMDTISWEVGRDLTNDEKVYVLKTVFRVKDWRQITIPEAEDMVATLYDGLTMKAIVSLVKEKK